jgi:stage IV sporulation protein FB
LRQVTSMGWQDRDYNRIGSTRFQNPIWNLLFGSLPLGTWFGIRVRIHATLILLIVGELIFAQTAQGYGIRHTLAHLAVLFGIIVLHEFGHCLGARMMGGEADEVLLWPLGGLAYARPPHRAWPTFVTVAAGPAVNVIICVIAGGALWGMGHFDWRLINPFISFSGREAVSPETLRWIFVHPGGMWLFWIFTTSLSLLFFNLLPIFPLDGGQMLQSILWKPLGYRRSMDIACVSGMVGAGVGFLLGLVGVNWMLLALAVSGFITCYQMRRTLQMNAYDEGGEDHDLSAAWDNGAARKPRRKLKKRWFHAARKRALADQAQQAKIDAILAKVKEKGLHSLSWWEKRTLRKATERQRQQDLAGRL